MTRRDNAPDAQSEALSKVFRKDLLPSSYQTGPRLQVMPATDLATMTAADLEDLVHLARERERQEEEARAAEIAERAELRDHWRERIPDRVALGAFPRRDTLEAPTATEIYTEDPSRLVAFVVEVRRFCGDELRVVEVAADFASKLGIPDDLAEASIAEGLGIARAARRGGGNRAS
jgi:hypothetical protein